MQSIIIEQLTAFSIDLKYHYVFRRENEIVNRFALAYLAKCLDIERIGIEVAVPNTKVNISNTGKPRVRKDLVIWREKGQSCFDSDGKPTIAPEWIIEFKWNAPRASDYDRDWLMKITEEYPETSGMLVLVKDMRTHYAIQYSVIRDGKCVLEDRIHWD
jgi:hypothetical protein